MVSPTSTPTGSATPSAPAAAGSSIQSVGDVQSPRVPAASHAFAVVPASPETSGVDSKSPSSAASSGPARGDVVELVHELGLEPDAEPISDATRNRRMHRLLLALRLDRASSAELRTIMKELGSALGCSGKLDKVTGQPDPNTCALAVAFKRLYEDPSFDLSIYQLCAVVVAFGESMTGGDVAQNLATLVSWVANILRSRPGEPIPALYLESIIAASIKGVAKPPAPITPEMRTSLLRSARTLYESNRSDFALIAIVRSIGEALGGPRMSGEDMTALQSWIVESRTWASPLELGDMINGLFATQHRSAEDGPALAELLDRIRQSGASAQSIAQVRQRIARVSFEKQLVGLLRQSPGQAQSGMKSFLQTRWKGESIDTAALEGILDQLAESMARMTQSQACAIVRGLVAGLGREHMLKKNFDTLMGWIVGPQTDRFRTELTKELIQELCARKGSPHDCLGPALGALLARHVEAEEMSDVVWGICLAMYARGPVTPAHCEAMFEAILACGATPEEQVSVFAALCSALTFAQGRLFRPQVTALFALVAGTNATHAAKREMFYSICLSQLDHDELRHEDRQAMVALVAAAPVQPLERAALIAAMYREELGPLDRVEMFGLIGGSDAPPQAKGDMLWGLCAGIGEQEDRGAEDRDEMAALVVERADRLSPEEMGAFAAALVVASDPETMESDDLRHLLELFAKPGALSAAQSREVRRQVSNALGGDQMDDDHLLVFHGCFQASSLPFMGELERAPAESKAGAPLHESA
jgi:hypothetical protein